MGRCLARALGWVALTSDCDPTARHRDGVTVVVSRQHPLITVLGSRGSWWLNLVRIERIAQIALPDDALALPRWVAYARGGVPPHEIARLATADIALGGAIVAMLAEGAAALDDPEAGPNECHALCIAIAMQQREMVFA
jgi:hypothetical protein